MATELELAVRRALDHQRAHILAYKGIGVMPRVDVEARHPVTGERIARWEMHANCQDCRQGDLRVSEAIRAWMDRPPVIATVGWMSLSPQNARSPRTDHPTSRR